ncbi:Aspartyl/glutamyl-tRNA(Asn/Gln) amidotransferase subunit B [uncultured archaeon]|nr:Aspartyl/glutamyl-tRNA(Asn/Gln) amidotransferase subunit B [uncultured archaeon]
MKTIIGLEIHVQLNTQAKMFCECPTNYGHVEPNTNICPICSGQPGGKPMAMNKEAISHVLKIAKMLDAKPELEKDIFVQRKHYFYPDLPSGYQRTSKPVAKDGKLNGIGIWEVHFEEDPGRYELKKGLVDYNRSGVPLVEIVTAPDMRSPEEAREFLGKLEHYLRYYNVIKDEVGTMRIDANISQEGSARVEVKNINSFSNVYDALAFEIKRQRTQIEQGVKIVQETRHFDENSGITVRLRKKETADDYRYVPDPDIPPIAVSAADWKAAEAIVAELPDARAQRISNERGITGDDAKVLTIEREFADAYESLAKGFEAQKFANWMRGPLRKQLNYRNLLFRNSGLNAKHIRELYEMFSTGKITDKAADQILMKMLDTDVLVKARKSGTYVELKEKPHELAKDLGLLRSSDAGALKAACAEAVKETPQAVEDYRAGNAKSIFFLVGKVMQKTKGTADAKEVEKAIKEMIG